MTENSVTHLLRHDGTMLCGFSRKGNFGDSLIRNLNKSLAGSSVVLTHKLSSDLALILKVFSFPPSEVHDFRWCLNLEGCAVHQRRRTQMLETSS